MAVYAFYVGAGTWRDKLIRWATRRPASHVEYVVGGVLGKSNTCISASKRDGNKVRAKPITWTPAHWVFVETDGDDATIYKRLIAEMGKPYDAWGAVLSVTPFNWHRAGMWFCNELQAHAADMPHPHRGTPGTFFDELMAMGGKVRHINGLV